MKNVLIISGHPRLSKSTSNRIILEQILRDDSVTVSDILTNYPGMRVDIIAEQEKLAAADLIIFQFPFVWYGMPSHMKAWMEKVFSPGFAYEEDGSRLKGKSLLLSVTLGGDQLAYSEAGKHGFRVETYLQPIKNFVEYCGMLYLPPLYSYAMFPVNDNPGELEQKALEHARKLESIIANFKQDSLTKSKLYI